VNDAFISGASGPWGVAVGGGYIYWTNRGTAGGSPCGGSIGRANLDGTDVDQNFIEDVDGPTGITVNGAYLYWSNGCGDSIGRANLDGSNADTNFITGPTQPSDLTTDGTYLYWGNFASPKADGGGSTIGRATLAGSGVNESFITGASSPTGIAATTEPVRCVVPKLTGKTLVAAKKALEAAHCSLGRVTRRRASGKAERVLSEHPSVGRSLPANSKVALTVSRK
jgi:hypothetical protein